MSSCPICYCMVEEKFMSMHVVWHDETDPQQEEYQTAQHVPIDLVEYEL